MKQAWLLRPHPDNVKRLEEFRRDEITAIGWAELGDLSGLTREALKAKLQAGPFLLSGTRLGNSYATVDIFVNRMQKGDLLLVPDGDDIFFARVESGYFFEPGRRGDGYPHQRHVTWLRHTASSALSMELRMSLKSQRTAADLTKHLPEIEALARGEENPAREAHKTIAVSYPLRRDFSVRFEVPENLTKAEAKRLASFFEGLYFEEEAK